MSQLTSLEQLSLGTSSLEVPDAVPKERIGFDLTRISNLAASACLSSTVYFSNYRPPATMDAFRAPSQLGQSRERPPLADYSLEEPPKGDPALEGFRAAVLHTIPKVNIHLNVDEMARRIHAQNRPESDPYAWSQQLSKGVNKALRAASQYHLLTGASSVRELAVFAAVDSFSTAWDMALGDPVAEAWLANTATLSAGFLMYKIFLQALTQRRLAGACYSLLPGIHIDRYGLFEASLLGGKRLVRTIG